MKHAYLGYRQWSYKILQDLHKEGFDIDAYTVEKNEYPSLSYDKSSLC